MSIAGDTGTKGLTLAVAVQLAIKGVSSTTDVNAGLYPHIPESDTVDVNSRAAHTRASSYLIFATPVSRNTGTSTAIAAASHAASVAACRWERTYNARGISMDNAIKGIMKNIAAAQYNDAAPRSLFRLSSELILVSRRIVTNLLA
jgi:hypothetical protein